MSPPCCARGVPEDGLARLVSACCTCCAGDLVDGLVVQLEASLTVRLGQLEGGGVSAHLTAPTDARLSDRLTDLQHQLSGRTAASSRELRDPWPCRPA